MALSTLIELKQHHQKTYGLFAQELQQLHQMRNEAQTKLQQINNAIAQADDNLTAITDEIVKANKKDTDKTWQLSDDGTCLETKE